MTASENRNIEEQELWTAFLQGDDSCIEMLYRRYFDELYNYGLRWQKNSGLVEDCIQDLFIKLMKNRANLSTPVSVKHYLFRALRSIILDKAKVKSNIRFVDEPGDHLFIFDLCPENQIVAQEEEQSLRQKLSTAFNSLTPRQREAIFLRYIEGFSYKEISEMMELTQKATYKLMARAIEAMKNQMIFIGLIISQLFISLFPQ